MMRASLLFAAALALCACLPLDQAKDSAGEPQGAAAGERAAVEAIAGAYTLAEVGSPNETCRVTLDPSPAVRAAGLTIRSLSFGATCREHIAALAAARQWAWTGGGSISLFGGGPTRELAHFSPVQDATGVFLRGGFAGDAAIYELRRPDP